MDIICISSIDWDFNWQGHQEIMATLAQQGHRVLFVENTGVRRPRLSDAARLVARIKNWRRGVKGFRRERDNLFVYSPVLLPFPQSRIASYVNSVLLARSIRRWMRAVRFDQPLVWTFLPTPLAVDLIKTLEPALVVYYCIADFEQLSPNAKAIRRSERRLLDLTDVVFAQGPELRDRCLPHSNVHIFPFGVSLRSINYDSERAPELKGCSRPIIGYLGGLHRHVDFELLDRIANEIPGTLALVGPTQERVDELLSRQNVAFMGMQPHHRISEFLKSFDVGLIPYKLSDYTRTVFPTKLNEYLAMGLPVVSTRLPEVERFAAENPGMVDLAADTDSFLEAVRKNAAASPDVACVEARQRTASDHDWPTRIEQMWEIVVRTLDDVKHPAGWEQSLQRLYLRARSQIFGAFVAVALIFIAVFYTPLPWVLASPLRMEDQPQPSDAIVVFAGGVGESGDAGGGYQERVKHGIDLYQRGLAPRMIFSSGFVFAFREAEIMQALAERGGVPHDAIILETHAANTYQNVTRVQEILREHGWNRVLLVSSPYHMRRAIWTWRKVSPSTDVRAEPVTVSQFYDHHVGASLPQIEGIAHEYLAIVLYWWRGWI